MSANQTTFYWGCCAASAASAASTSDSVQPRLLSCAAPSATCGGSGAMQSRYLVHARGCNRTRGDRNMCSQAVLE